MAVENVEKNWQPIPDYLEGNETGLENLRNQNQGTYFYDPAKETVPEEVTARMNAGDAPPVQPKDTTPTTFDFTTFGEGYKSAEDVKNALTKIPEITTKLTEYETKHKPEWEQKETEYKTLLEKAQLNAVDDEDALRFNAIKKATGITNRKFITQLMDIDFTNIEGKDPAERIILAKQLKDPSINPDMEKVLLSEDYPTDKDEITQETYENETSYDSLDDDAKKKVDGIVNKNDYKLSQLAKEADIELKKISDIKLPEKPKPLTQEELQANLKAARPKAIGAIERDEKFELDKDISFNFKISDSKNQELADFIGEIPFVIPKAERNKLKENIADTLLSGIVNSSMEGIMYVKKNQENELIIKNIPAMISSIGDKMLEKLLTHETFKHYIKTKPPADAGGIKNDKVKQIKAESDADFNKIM